MREYVSDAIVLDREGIGEADARVVFYTEKLGRVAARATSARRINSKLSAHLEPGLMVRVRFVEKRGAENGGIRFQVTDALGRTRPPFAPAVLRLVAELGAEGEPDPALWHALARGRATVREALALLGFDPRHAVCEACGAPAPSRFSPRRAEYFCEACVRTEGGAAESSFVEVNETAV